MEPNPQLENFLHSYDKDIRSLFMGVRSYLLELVPETNELIWDNYNALAIAYSKSEKLKDAFCHIAVYANYVNFGFNRGAELTKRGITLEGKGKLIRHIRVMNLESLPKQELKQLIYEAVGISEESNPTLRELELTPKSIVMSISEKKIRPKNYENK